MNMKAVIYGAGLFCAISSSSLKPVDVKIDRADVILGWRAILDKEIHLNRTMWLICGFIQKAHRVIIHSN